MSVRALPVTLLLSACAAPAEDPRFAEVVAWTEAQLEVWMVPGAALVVVEDGELRHAAGMGVREWGRPEPVTPSTRFRVGSISKLFTGVLALQEARAGRLDLDAPADTTLPGLALHDPSALAQISLQQLLSHQSGLQTAGLPNACDTDPGGLVRTLQAEAPGWDLWTPPGELYNYSNNGFALAGYAIEAAAGQPFADLARDRLFAPLALTATYDIEEVAAGNYATGHTMDLTTGEPLQLRGLEERACAASFPSGGMMASVLDLGRVAQVFLRGGDPWLPPAALEQMTSSGWAFSETTSYGFGLQAGTYRDHRRWSHSGSLGGYFAILWIFPDDNLAMAALVNSDHLVTEIPEPDARPTSRILIHTADAFLGLEPEEDAGSSARAVEDWDRYVGTYRSEFAWGTQQIRREAGQLIWESAEDGTATPLLPYGRDSFLYPYVSSLGDRTLYRTLSFEGLDEDGRSTWLIGSDGAARRLPRAPGEPPQR